MPIPVSSKLNSRQLGTYGSVLISWKLRKFNFQWFSTVSFWILSRRFRELHRNTRKEQMPLGFLLSLWLREEAQTKMSTRPASNRCMKSSSPWVFTSPAYTTFMRLPVYTLSFEVAKIKYTSKRKGVFRVIIFEEDHRLRHPWTKAYEAIKTLQAEVHWFLTATSIVNNSLIDSSYWYKEGKVLAVQNMMNILMSLWPFVLKFTVNASDDPTYLTVSDSNPSTTSLWYHLSLSRAPPLNLVRTSGRGG